jgi:serine/threonine protein kinase/DNA-binding NarL/FixJ family response regulator
MISEKSSQSQPVLVVDDNADFLKSIKFTLESKGITDVDCCHDSQKVMPLLENKKYSLILLDWFMPDISGEVLLPRITEKYPEIPVIVLTGEPEYEIAVECMRFGAFDFLVKGFEPSHLLTKVRDTFDFINIEADNILKVFDFSNEKSDYDNKKALLKIDFLLRTGKAQLIIDKIAPLIENQMIKKANVGLFYYIGEAYEKIDDFEKAVSLYEMVAKLDSNYRSVQEKLEKVRDKKKRYSELSNTQRYRKIEEIGEGAMGSVFMAEDKRLDRMVALKILTQKAKKDERGEKRFISEGKKVAKLHHPNIVTVYDVGHIQNDCFISMEFIKGINLYDLIKRKNPIAIEKILFIARKLFDALAHSHKNYVIHRDIKPSNIMITYENQVKVVDFGIAILKDEIKNSYEIYGTPCYMSPEQFENSTIDHRTDIYSAGVTLFNLVTGRAPFIGTYTTVKEKHFREPVPSIKDIRKDIPEKLIQIIEKCMEKKKEDRYQRASEVIKELDKIRDRNGNAYITANTKLKILDPSDINNLIPESDQDTEPYGDKFIDEIDIPTFAYHLVLSNYASPELLTDINHVELKKAIPKINTEKKGTEDLIPALRVFEYKYSGQSPKPLWHSWITATQGEKINEVKKMLKEMIRQ